VSLISEGWFREQGKKGVLIPRFALRKRGLEQGLVRFTEGGVRGNEEMDDCIGERENHAMATVATKTKTNRLCRNLEPVVSF
jgi:hypothetical protein